MIKEPLTANLLLAFDDLVVAINRMEVALPQDMSARIGELTVHKMSFRRQFNQYFVRRDK